MRLFNILLMAFATAGGMAIEFVYHPIGSRVNPVRTASKWELTEGDVNLLKLKSLSMMRVDYSSDVAPQATKTFFGITTGWSQVPMNVTANVTIGLNLDTYNVIPVENEPGVIDLELLAPQVMSINTDFLSLFTRDRDLQVVRGYFGFGSGNEGQLVYNVLFIANLSGLVRVCQSEAELREQAQVQAREIWSNLLGNHGVKLRSVTFQPRPWIKGGNGGVALDCGQGEQMLSELLNKK